MGLLKGLSLLVCKGYDCCPILLQLFFVQGEALGLGEKLFSFFPMLIEP